MEKSSRITLVADVSIEGPLRTEILATDLPATLELAIHVLSSLGDLDSPSQTQNPTVSKADHVFCDGVFFIGPDVRTLAKLYLRWMEGCRDLSVIGQVRPLAYLHCWKARFSKQELDAICLAEPGGEDVLAAQSDDPAFRRTNVVKDKNIVPVGDMIEAMNEGLAIRSSLCLDWDTRQSVVIKAAYIRHLETRNRNMFRVRAIAPPTDVFVKTGINPVQALTATNRHRVKKAGFVKTVADYYGYYYCSQPNPVLCKSDHRGINLKRHSRSLLLDSLANSSVLTVGVKKWLRTRVIAKYQAWADAHLASDSFDHRLALTTHIANLRSSASFLRSQEYGPMCVLCLSRPMRSVLGCNKHALCARCKNQTVQVNEPGCPICNSQTRAYNSTSLRHSRGRILSLDGGGVKGFIQLEILRMIELEIGLDLPLHRFFDLIVGTSIGKIGRRKV
jgi:hypothetical protein